MLVGADDEELLARALAIAASPLATQEQALERAVISLQYVRAQNGTVVETAIFVARLAVKREQTLTASPRLARKPRGQADIRQ